MRKLAKNQYFSVVILLILAVAVKAIQFFPGFIESYYLPYFQQPIAKLLRVLFGWLPVSLGDLVYLGIIVYLVFIIIKGIRQKTFWKWRSIRWKVVLSRLLLVYIIFSLCWGVLYNRKGIQYQLQLAQPNLQKTEVLQLLSAYTDSVNMIAPFITDDDSFHIKVIKNELFNAYETASKHYPFLKQQVRSFKKSLFSGLFNYFGLQGYYNPFTGEAQYNQLQPSFAIPNVALHEMAHQLGYAKEDEANFVGFLAAMHSSNAYIKYSYYMDVWMYSAMELAHDSDIVNNIKTKLHATPLKHMKQWAQYKKKYHSIMNTITGWIYNKFLTLNDSSKGIFSYNEVLRILVAFEKKKNIITQ